MVFEDGFCFFAFCFALRRRMGVSFYLFLVVKAETTHLTYVMTTHRHVFPLRHIQGILLSCSLFRIHSLC